MPRNVYVACLVFLHAALSQGALGCVNCSAIKSSALLAPRTNANSRTSKGRKLLQQPSTVAVATAAAFITAIVDPAISLVRLTTPTLSISPAAWDASGFAIPILVSRDILIDGDPALGDMPVLDFQGAKEKIRLAANTTLRFERLFLPRMRAKPTRAPGLDILAPATGGTNASVEIHSAAGSFGVCWSLAYQLLDFASVQQQSRPSQFPGTNTLANYQTYDMLKQLGCVDSSSAPPLQRCWAAKFLVVDLAGVGADYDSVRDLLVPNNMVIYLTNNTAFCETLVDEQCVSVQGKEPLLCFTEAEKRLEAASEAAVNKSSAGGSGNGIAVSGGGGGSSSASQGATASVAGGGSQTRLGSGRSGASTGGLTGGARVGVIVGASIGGAVLVAVAAAAMVVRRRRARTRGTTPDVAGAAAACDMLGQSDLGQEGQQGKEDFNGLSNVRSNSSEFGGTCGVTTDGTRRTDSSRPLPPKRASTVGVIHAADGSAILSPPDNAVGSSDGDRRIATATHPPPAAWRWSTGGRRLPTRQRRPMDAPVTPLTRPRRDVALSVQLQDSPSGSASASAAASTAGQQHQPPTAPSPQAAKSSPRKSPAAAEAGEGDGDSGDSGGDSSSNNSNNSGGGGDAVDATASGGPPVVQLLPVTLGKGSFGRVVEGVFGGRRVAVKLMTGEGPWGTGEQQQPVEQLQGEQQQQPGEQQQQQKQQQQKEQSDDARNYANAFVQSFMAEVQVLSRVQHPNVVQLLAACVTPPRLCLVMELMETSLERLLYGKRLVTWDAGREPPPPAELMPLEKVLHIGIEIATALAYLHPTIVHRDLKPANVLVNGPEDDRPIIKLSDFGLSRLRVATASTKHPDAGTPPYMAPECFDVCNKHITHQADMYSLGVLVWEMLAGCPPWAGVQPVAIAYMVAYQGARLPLHALDINRCPAKLASLLVSCWETDPARRPAAEEAAKQMVLVLEKLKRPTPPQQPALQQLQHY